MYTVCHIAHRFARYIIVDKPDSIVDGMPINKFPVFLDGKTNDIGDSGIGHSPRHTHCLGQHRHNSCIQEICFRKFK